MRESSESLGIGLSVKVWISHWNGLEMYLPPMIFTSRNCNWDSMDWKQSDPIDSLKLYIIKR